MLQGLQDVQEPSVEPEVDPPALSQRQSFRTSPDFQRVWLVFPLN